MRSIYMGMVGALLTLGAAYAVPNYAYEGNASTNIATYRNYEYEKFDCFMPEYPKFCGNSSYVAATVYFERSFPIGWPRGYDSVRVNPETGTMLSYTGTIWVNWSDYCGVSGFAALPGDELYVGYYGNYGPAYPHVGLLGDTSGEYERHEDDMSYYKNVATRPDYQYYYCYRRVATGGPYYICKSTPGSAAVLTSFAPAGDVTDMAASSTGYVYITDGTTITRYGENGAVLNSWTAPAAIVDLTAAPGDEVLALSAATKYTYEYTSAGSLVGSFTAPYTLPVNAADMGPGGKYYVLSSQYQGDTFWVYRFRLSPTRVAPTSLGRIKAYFK